MAFTLFSINMLMSMVNVLPAKSGPSLITSARSAGVKAGDWAIYSVDANYSTNDPSPPIVPVPGLTEWKNLQLTVLSVSGTNVTYRLTARFEDDTEESSVEWIDVDSGRMRYGTTSTGLFIAANLTAGDQVYANPIAPTINHTIMRFYAGMNREVNCYVANMSNPGGHPSGDASEVPEVRYQAFCIEYIWDRTSGIVVELKVEMEHTVGEYRTYFFLHLAMLETGIWSAGLSVNIKVTPKVLNLKSRGNWVTVQIELPEGYKAKDVDSSTILLNGTIPPETLSKGKGSSQIMVKFDRQNVINLILPNWRSTRKFGSVTLIITGELVDGAHFQGNAAIWIVSPMSRGVRAFPIFTHLS